jgi:hypothetical protein
MADPQIDELKELVRQNIRLSQETNRLVHGMRRADRLKSLIWWALILVSVGISVWSYYTFVEPRVNQIKSVYQQNVGMAESIQKTFNDFLKGVGIASSTSK